LALLAEGTAVPFTVENNANAAAFGALYAQPSLPSTCTLFLKLGTGCGGAAIVNGRLLRGAQGTGLEAGHIRLTEQGALCSCGQTGCLESWVNLAALARLARGNADLSDAEFTDLPAQVAAEAERGEPRAVAALQSLSHHLGLGLVSLINLFNPTTILLGGVMRPVMERVLPDLRAAVTARIIPGTRAPEILLSTLGEQECAVGAACIAHHKAFDLSNVEIGMPPLREAALG
jgi:predicted NBD/HSP70 family sugar kinase